MLVRLVLAIICSAVALRCAQLKKQWDESHGYQKRRNDEELRDGKEIYTYADVHASKEEEAEVKHVSSVSSSLSSRSCQERDHLLLPEFDDLFQGGVILPSDFERSPERINFDEDGARIKYESDESRESRKYESNSEDDEALSIFEALAMSSKAHVQALSGLNGSEQLAQLKALVANLQEKEMTLEAELLECYRLKEQQEHTLQLEKQLWEKDQEIKKLNVKLIHLEEQAMKLSKEVECQKTLKEELEEARIKVKGLQMMIQSDSSQTKGQLLILKQQVSIFEDKEKEFSKRDLDMERKFQILKELEVEALELRRMSKELQHQKRALTVKLDAAEAKVIELSSITESDKVVQVQAEVSALRFVNEDLSKQVEGLQMNRFSEVEELVYLRWVNACLRYELRNYQAPPGKASALDLGKSLSPKSQEKAKQLMMEYASPDLSAVKTQTQSEQEEYASPSSLPSTTSEFGFDDFTFDDHLSSHSSSRKSGLINKLKKWGRSKEAPELSFISSSSTDSTKSKMQNSRHRRAKSRGSLESLFMRTSNDPITITTFEISELDRQSSSDFNRSPGEIAVSETRSSVDGNDLSSDVAASFELMSRSIFSVSEIKYPTFKDRHKLACEREKGIKAKADQARTEKLEEKLEPEAASRVQIEKVTSIEIGKAIPKENNKILPMKVDREAPKKLYFPERAADIVPATEPSPVRVVASKIKLSEVQIREPRVPKPAPKPSSKSHVDGKMVTKPSEGRPPNPPPPPPPRTFGGPPPPPPPGIIKLQGSGTEKVQRAPEVVEFYQSLMRRDAKKDATMGASDVNVSDARSNMIGEIENRSAFLLAVKADVETQGDFVQALAMEVRTAAFDDIEDVAGFVSWLDEELSFLVDERAVLKHFDWPETKADVFREAAFEYQDLEKLYVEVSSFKDDPQMPYDSSLKRMLSLLEKVEQSVYAVLRTRDMAIARYKEFGVPIQWMLDSGLVGKIKLGTVQLARKYMERVAYELDSGTASAKEPHREFLLLQGVRFAFRVHQFAGGFDTESMRMFEELRRRVHACGVDHFASESHKTT